MKTGIKNLEIPDTVEEVDHYAFAYIQAPYVVLPKTIKKIGVCVFAGAKTIEVFDTIDSDAKPAADYVDSANGRCNGILGMIGMSVMGIRDYKVSRNGYETYGFYNTHTIIVRSAADDSIKYSVIIPKSINRTVYCTYISSWEKMLSLIFLL